jgi:hypothetical protein
MKKRHAGDTALRLGLMAMASAYVVGALQIVAAFAAIRHYADWHWLISGALALTVGWTPVVGSGMAIYGATHAWGWHWLAAAVLFLWPLLLLPVFMLAKHRASRR